MCGEEVPVVHGAFDFPLQVRFRQPFDDDKSLFCESLSICVDDTFLSAFSSSAQSEISTTIFAVRYSLVINLLGLLFSTSTLFFVPLKSF